MAAGFVRMCYFIAFSGSVKQGYLMRFIRSLSGCLALMLAFAAHAWDRPAMAPYGEVYLGVKLLEVHVANTKDEKNAVITIRGINHPYNGQVFFTKMSYQQGDSGHFRRWVVYEDTKSKKELLRLYDDSEDVSGVLFLPDYRGRASAVMGVSYDRNTSLNVLPEKMMSDYERQIGVGKP
jgi:hypothetical protein